MLTEIEKLTEIQNDTLNLLLCSRVHENLSVKQRAMKIAKCCKAVRDRTKDRALYNACRSIIKAVSEGIYDDAVKSLELTELNYWKKYLIIKEAA